MPPKNGNTRCVHEGQESLYRLLKQIRSLKKGRQVQELICENGLAGDLFLAAHLIRMFTFFRSLPEAQQVFNSLSNPSPFVWSAIISAHTHLGHPFQALDLYIRMQQKMNSQPPNEFVFISVLKASGKVADLHVCKFVHAHILESCMESKIMVANTLIDTYGKCGHLDDAFHIFSSRTARDVVTWNAIISAYCQHDHIDQAFCLFGQMQEEGIERDSATWNVLINAHALHGKCEDALLLFNMMMAEGVYPSQATFASITMHVCSSVPYLKQGKNAHVLILENNLGTDCIVGSCLINMYSNNGSIENARLVFDRIKHRDIVTWNSMISGYVQHGYGHLGIQLFVQMMEAGIKPDNYTYVGIVKASTSVGALDQGKWVHSLAAEHGFESDEYVASALIDMYGKWHRLTDGSNVFKRVTQPNTVTWNALFSGYAQHGEFKEAWDIYLSMRNKGFAPDGVTFICLLSACGHEALIEESIIHLESMHKVHGVEPCFDHFACMLDIFGRAGHINEAMQLLHAIRSPGHDTIWRSLLSHCKTHGSLELGRQCFDKLTAMDAGDSSCYVLMSQLCMDAGEWEEALKLEAQRKSLDARKKPGMAFIEINNQVHHFVTGDLSYPAEGKPRPKIKMLKTAMLQMGYIALLDSVIK